MYHMQINLKIKEMKLWVSLIFQYIKARKD